MEKEIWGSAQWIWPGKEDFYRKKYVAFRQKFEYCGGEADLQITADARYLIWVNGKYVQFGPARSYPKHYGYDIISIKKYLVKGKNVLAVLVKHFGISTFHSMLQPGGLLFRLRKKGGDIFSGTSCLCRSCPEYSPYTPRISCQQEYEEQVDARLYDGWREPDYDDSRWFPAVSVRAAEDGYHSDYRAREIPFLLREEKHPRRAICVQAVRKISYISFDIGFLLEKDLFSDTPYLLNCGFIVEVESARAQECPIVYREMFHNLTVNGESAEDILCLKRGKNFIAFYERGILHPTQATLSFQAKYPISIGKIRMVGPFSPQEADGSYEKSDIGYYKIIGGAQLPAELPAVLSDLVAEGNAYEQYVCDITQYKHETNVFAENYRADGEILNRSPDLAALCGEGLTLNCGGKDLTLLVDFGEELIGFLSFEADAAPGTVLDFHLFEFIQPDGRKNYAEGMNDTMRYICGGGPERYESVVRRGGRYLYITVRGCDDSVRLSSLKMIDSAYPQQRRGEFFCSDYLLNYIYDCSRATLRCCMEDTYTDCPTYEQTYWVGDMRNEALVDWLLNGDARLWKRCLILAGQSLDYSDIVLSQVPSGWWNILPAWTMLWMLSASEYWLYTGDAAGIRELFPYLKRNLTGLKKYADACGLLKIYGWNMFDWAPMDTPVDGIVAHINFLACLALRANAALADECGEAEFGRECRALYESIAAAANKLLWDKDRCAYADCLRKKGGNWIRSETFSQQAQTTAFLSGAAQGERRAACLGHVKDPKDMVTSGSPFFSFFLLEVLREEDDEQLLFDTLRENWGMMTDTGCNTFWEQWGYPTPDGRITRSHCHGWSACPAYFMSEYVLGVRPAKAGYAEAILRPHAGKSLRFARGAVPTPHGEIFVQWEYADGKYTVRCKAPSAVKITEGRGEGEMDISIEKY